MYTVLLLLLSQPLLLLSRSGDRLGYRLLLLLPLLILLPHAMLRGAVRTSDAAQDYAYEQRCVVLCSVMRTSNATLCCAVLYARTATNAYLRMTTCRAATAATAAAAGEACNVIL